MRTVTATLPAFLTNDWTTPEELLTGDQERVAGLLMYCPRNCAPASWVQVGTAKLEVTLIDERELVDNKVESLKSQLQKTQADAEVACNRIREQIQSLLAISYKPEVEA